MNVRHSTCVNEFAHVTSSMTNTSLVVRPLQVQICGNFYTRCSRSITKRTQDHHHKHFSSRFVRSTDRYMQKNMLCSTQKLPAALQPARTRRCLRPRCPPRCKVCSVVFAWCCVQRTASRNDRAHRKAQVIQDIHHLSNRVLCTLLHTVRNTSVATVSHAAIR